jgi:hypothetical protein
VQPQSAEPDPAVYDEIDALRREVGELAERVDFAERLLAKQSDVREVASGEP